MNQPSFPTRRDDGSVFVAARFAFDAQAAIEDARAKVKDWIAQRATERIDLTEDLTAAPHVAVRDDHTLDVVFDGRPGSPRWKDWMVAITKEMASTVPSRTFVCFYDLVGNLAHPGSRYRL